MCFFSTPQPPKPPPLPVTPTRNNEETRARADEEEKRLRAMRGREATILTSGLGDSSFGRNVARTQLGAA